MKKLALSIMAITALTSGSAMAAEQSKNLCEPQGYTVGFFNGVGNDYNMARAHARLLKNELGVEHNGEAVKYELFFNPTAKVESSILGAPIDIVEALHQRLVERSPSFASLVSPLGFFNGAYEEAFESVPASPEVKEMLSEFAEYKNELLAEAIQGSGALDEADDVYQQHNNRLVTLLSHGKKVVLVGHSQGTLFMNNAYRNAIDLGIATPENIKAVYVAPAASEYYGEYVLADMDMVINVLLRIPNTGYIPPSNVEIPLQHLKDVDKSGHGFAETYLYPSLATKPKVLGLIESSLDNVVAPAPTASQGSFTVTFSWNGMGDADLHVFEPTGKEVYFGDRWGDVGQLDLDNTHGHGPEHYFASCNADELVEGKYSIYANNWSRAEGRLVTAQLSTPQNANLISRSLRLNDDPNKQYLFDVIVSKDEDQNVSITAQ